MSIPQFDNPLERLSVLPNVINWQGGWVSGGQYFMNDIVVDSLTSASFILTGATSLISVINPSSDSNWSTFAGTSTGVIGINQGAGILLTGTATNPIVNNNGVISLRGGASISIDDTDPHNPIVSSTAITQIIPGDGISVTGLPIPIVSNTGVINITVGAGLLSSGGATPSISNTGLLSIAGGTGITSSGGQNPSLTNTGVISITPGANVTNTGDSQNVILNATAPQLCMLTVLNFATLITTPFPIPPAIAGPPITPGVGVVNLVGYPPSPLFTDYLANGAPDANGVFMIDMTGLSLLYTATGQCDGNTPYTTFIRFIDATTAGGPYGYSCVSSTPNVTIGAAFPFPFNLGLLEFNIADARAAGLRVIDNFQIINSMFSPVELVAGQGIYATYFPEGVQ